MWTENRVTMVSLAISTSLFAAFVQIAMAADVSSKCTQDLEFCPSGHFMADCIDKDGENGRYCLQCPDGTYQPDQNRYPDKCRLMRLCDKKNMEYKEFGSTIKDAECGCINTHHLLDDQRACVENSECGKGFGVTVYGKCEECIKKNMFSDTVDKIHACQPLTKCAETSRCTQKRSNGTSDNVCAPYVDDISKCESLLGNKGLTGGALAGVIIGVLVLFIVLFLVCLYLYRRRHKGHRKADLEVSRERIDAAVSKIVECSREDKDFCRKVCSLSNQRVEQMIGRQNWALAQDLFRNHPQPGKYEVIVQKYKDVQSPNDVKGYLEDWREWTGSLPESFRLLAESLRKVERTDIVLDICRRIKTESDIDLDIPSGYSNGHTNRVIHFKSLLPCIKSQRNKGNLPANGKHTETRRNVQPLLNQGRANNEDEESHVVNINYGRQPSAPPLIGEFPLVKPESTPIQASS